MTGISSHQFQGYTYVDEDEFRAADSKTMANFLLSLPDPQKTVFQKGYKIFYSRQNLMVLIKKQDPEFARCADGCGVTLPENTEEIVKAFLALVKGIEASVSTAVGYTLAEIPERWFFENHFDVSRHYVRRNGYAMGIKSAERLWNFASNLWKELDEGLPMPDIRSLALSAHGKTRSGVVSEQGIEIGCQTVSRFEVEQLALHMGWSFPK